MKHPRLTALVAFMAGAAAIVLYQAATSTPEDAMATALQAEECQELKVEQLEPRWVNYANVPLFMPQGMRRTYLCRGGVFLVLEE